MNGDITVRAEYLVFSIDPALACDFVFLLLGELWCPANKAYITASGLVRKTYRIRWWCIWPFQ